MVQFRKSRRTRKGGGDPVTKVEVIKMAMEEVKGKLKDLLSEDELKDLLEKVYEKQDIAPVYAKFKELAKKAIQTAREKIADEEPLPEPGSDSGEPLSPLSPPEKDEEKKKDGKNGGGRRRGKKSRRKSRKSRKKSRRKRRKTRR